jgi:cation transport regulator ChaC
MQRLGILAYGSLISHPGPVLDGVTARRIPGVTTPFQVEFARSSRNRGGAPTPVPVDGGGANVAAVLLVLDESVTLEQAKDMLWRRETHHDSTARRYPSKENPGCNDVVISDLEDLGGIEHVLYIELEANIPPASRTAERLADLAIESVAAVGREGLDGISYLIDIKAHGVSTPLMDAYETEILRRSETRSLEAARRRVLHDRSGPPHSWALA